MGTNAELIRLFNETADLLDLLGEDRFKVEAYRRAGRSLESLGEDVRKFADRGELGTIPGVGAALEEKIREYLRTGRIEYVERVRAQVPPGLLQIMGIPGFGPKTARRFWVELKVETPAELAAAVEAGRLNGVKGFGPRKIQVLKDGLAALGAAGGAASGARHPILVAWELAEALTSALRSAAPVRDLTVAGSLRRARESIGDIDILATSEEPAKVFDAFTALPQLTEVRVRGDTKETAIFAPGIQVDLRVVAPESYGAALQYFTGSKDHNIRLRSLARDRGLKINEYGVFRGEERVAGRTEAEVYAALELEPMPPEIRENRGEIEAATRHEVPVLVDRTDLRGDLHVHLADPASLPAWEAAARAQRLAYLGIALPAGTPRGSVEEIRRAWPGAGAGPVTLLLGAESDAPALPAPAWADYRILTASDGAPPPDPKGVGFVGHLPPASSEARARWLAWARSGKVGLEVTGRPGEDGLDSGEAAGAIAAGALLYVSSRADLPSEFVRLALAVKLARRGGALPRQVANTGPSPVARPGRAP